MLASPWTDEALAALLARCGLRLAAGAGARVVTARVVCAPLGDGEAVAVKRFAPDEGAAARVEATLLAHLGASRDPEVRVPSLVRARGGAALLTPDDGGARALVTRWCAGEKRSFDALSADTWTALGRTLAALHRALVDAPDAPLPCLITRLRARDLDAARDTLTRHRASVLAGARGDARARYTRYFDDRRALLEARAPRCLASLPDPSDAQPIHNDYNQHNYLFPPAGSPIIIDWERAQRAPREFEVVRCLNHLPLLAPALARRFIDGYLQRHTLDPARVAWAVDAALTAHALKDWPVELWLAGAPDADARLDAMAGMVRVLADGQAALEAFFTGPR